MQIDINKFQKYESGQMNREEEISFFQELIDKQIIGSLQGHYHRVAKNLIEEGLIKIKEL